jgi:hypothetical protein
MYPNRYISEAAAVVIYQTMLLVLINLKIGKIENPPPSIFELVFSTTPWFKIFKKLKRMWCANRNDRVPSPCS